MKIMSKSVSIFTLIVMMCNFFIAPITDVFADNMDEENNESSLVVEETVLEDDLGTSEEVLEEDIDTISEDLEDESIVSEEETIVKSDSSVLDTDKKETKVVSSKKSRAVIKNVPDATLIKEKIDALSALYSSSVTEFKTLADTNGLGSDITPDNTSTDYTLVSGFSSAVIDEFILKITLISDLDKDFVSLKALVDEYMDANPSDTLVSGLMAALENNYYRVYNEVQMYKIYSKFVSNADLGYVSNIKSLLLYKYLETSDSEYSLLNNTLEELYKPVLKSGVTDYQISISGDYVIAEYLSSDLSFMLNRGVLANDLDYAGESFAVNGSSENVSLGTTLELFDKAGLIKTYEVLVKNDINRDAALNNDDVNLLSSKLVNNNFSSIDVMISDFNGDGVLNIVDLNSLNGVINGTSLGTATQYSFNIVSNINKDKITYNVYLKSNGVVNAFDLSFKAGNNLVFDNFVPGNSSVVYANGVPLRVLGVGTFNNNQLLFSVTYSFDVSNPDDLVVNLDNGFIIAGDNNYLDNISTYNVTRNDVVASSPKPVVEPLVNEVAEDTSSDVVSLDEVLDDSTDVDNDSKKSSISSKELKDSDVIWGNVIKIVIIVLLGALIIYLLNKNSTNGDSDNEEKLEEFSKEKKKEDYKSKEKKVNSNKNNGKNKTNKKDMKKK